VGMHLLAAFFNNPYSPYLWLSANTFINKILPEIAIIAKQINILMPTIYITAKRISSATSPIAK
jgi:hypothetical protein